MSTCPLPAAVRILGVAGLLPPVLALAVAALWPASRAYDEMAAMIYAGLILSFLGGLWWMALLLCGRRALGPYVVAVLPSLIAWVLLIDQDWGRGAKPALLGTALVLSPWVDRALAGQVNWPDGWLRLRVALGLGLGALTTVWLWI
jgi:hypothetical protein